tara:strand:- start:257 stop:1969 length:1713 start_codon:yes stop_codon:yes gene_type:complete
MPSKSKAQQRFMGLVHAFNKGDVKGSEVSKKVKDVAKGMKKSDVKKYASTKHKGKPEKVKKEAIDKIREMIRMELEGCGYVMSAKNPSYKLKSPGGTGEEDKKLKEKIKNTEAGFRWNQIPNRGTINFGEYGKYLILNKTKMFVDGKYISGKLKGKKVRWYSKDGQRDARKRKGIPISKTPRFPYVMVKESILSEGEKEKIEQLLIKYGNTPEDAKQMIKKTYDYIKKAYRNANASKKAEIMSGLMKFETTEQFSNLVEKCWKGYMIHPKRKTKKLFGKTYPNCIKKEDTLYIEAMSAAQAKAAHKKFKQTGELPPHLKKLVKDLDKVKVKYKVKNIVVPGLEWMADIKDEGFASDAQRRAAFASGYKAKGKKKKKNESIIESIINEIASYKQFVKYMNDFYGPKGIYPDKKKRTLKMKDIGTAYSVLLKKKPDFEIGYDSTDREMLRDILIKMRKLDPDYSQKKESVSEAMDKRQGAEALQQLGGNRFIAMTGAKHFGVGPNGMSFKIGRNSKRVNHVTIDYDRGRDLYNMKFDWVTIKGIKNKKTLKGIYADQLQDMFTKYTGMYTSL